MKTLLRKNNSARALAGWPARFRRTTEGKPLTIVGVLIGSIVLLADLIRLLNFRCASIWCRPEATAARASGRDRWRLNRGTALHRHPGPRRAAGGRYFRHRPHPMGIDSAARRVGAVEHPQRRAATERKDAAKCR